MGKLSCQFIFFNILNLDSKSKGGVVSLKTANIASLYLEHSAK